MTYPNAPPYRLPPIDVVGQRLRPGGAFPAGPGGGGPGGGGDDGIHQNQVEDPGTQPYQPPPHPCGHPEARKIWNSDAAAAAAVAALAARAASLNDGSSLSNKEFGANLFINNLGQVDVTQIDAGPEAVVGDAPEVEILPHGTTYLDWMGDIHNHPSDGRLSTNERNQFNARIDRMIRDFPSRTEALALAAYVVVLDLTAPHGYRIYAHTRQTEADQLARR